MTITITQKHIDAGVRGSWCKCPIALAIKEKGKWYHAGKRWLLVNDVDYATPPVVHKWMDRFDEGLPVEPMSFELEAA